MFFGSNVRFSTEGGDAALWCVGPVTVIFAQQQF
jgi:hypothetical protein